MTTSLTRFIRVERQVGCAHGEAFQLMLYRADDGATAWFWNSRDGVTPFGTAIDGKEYRHAMHGYPTRYTAILPDEAEHVWVSYTPAAWEEMQRRRYDAFAARPDDQPYGGADFRDRFPTPEDWLKISPFEHGQPRQLTRAGFIAETSEWMGKPLIEDQAA